MIIDDNIKTEKTPKSYICDCGKKYNFASGLSRHKTNCNFQQDNSPKENDPKVDNIPKEDDRDKLINLLFKEKKEMKDLVLLLVKNLQEVLPHVGKGSGDVNGDNNHNHNNSHNTLNFYLTNTCKDAESITEFTA